MSTPTTLAGILAQYRTTFSILQRAREDHEIAATNINSMLLLGMVKGVPFRVGEDVPATGATFTGRDLRIENIFLKYNRHDDSYQIVATGAVVKNSGVPGTGRASASMDVPIN